MATYINLVALDGTTVGVNPEEVASLQPIPAATLPSGVVAGTYVQSEDGSRVGVQGTVAATIATLAGGSLAATPRGTFDGATGATVNATTGVSCVRTGAGVYEITFPVQTAAMVLASVEDTVASIVNADLNSGVLATITTFTDAGVAADCVRLNVVILPFP